MNRICNNFFDCTGYRVVALLVLSLSSVVFRVSSLIAQNSNVIDEIVWVVGGEPILKSDVEQSRLDAIAQGQSLDGNPYCVIPENLAIQKLFLHQAAVDSVDISDSDVYQQVDARLQFYIEQLGSREKMEEYFNKTYSQIREQLFTNVKESEMVNEVKRNLIKDVKVTPGQVRRYFKDLPADSLPFIPTCYELQIIQRNPKVEKEEIDRIKNDLRSYTDRVNSGKDQFSTLARLYSEDGSASRGGELGFMSRGQLVPEFATAAFNLTNPNTISKIVETEYGYHIIQLIEKRGDKVNVRHILKKPKISGKALNDCINMLDTVLIDVRDGKYTFEEAASILSQDKDTRNNFGNMVKKDPQTGMVIDSHLELRDLPSAVAREVSALKVGEISKPFIMITNQGKEVCAIVKLKKKIDGHRADMTEDYQILQDIVMEKESEKYLENWIREKQKTTYVRINEGWRDCEFKYPGWIKE